MITRRADAVLTYKNQPHMEIFTEGKKVDYHAVFDPDPLSPYRDVSAI